MLDWYRWWLATAVHHDLITDDTYRFTAAVAKFKPLLLSLTAPEDAGDLASETAEVPHMCVFLGIYSL